METLRKIELQEPEDLVYLINNVRAAATSQINEAFPPVADSDGQGDELRVQIEREVNEYINRTFHLALPNLTINGLDVSASQFLPPLNCPQDQSATSPGPGRDFEPVVVFEPYDNSKRARVEELSREEEDLLRDIAELKRKVPAAVASRFASSAAERLKVDDETLASLVSTLSAIHGPEGSTEALAANTNNSGSEATGPCSAKSTVEIKPLASQDEIDQAFGDAIKGLGRLKKDMPSTVAKMDQARLAGEYTVSQW